MVPPHLHSPPAEWKTSRVLLHFGAVDWETEVFVNGQKAGDHRGGYLPFTFDITDLLHDGENELVVAVWDPSDRGGQECGKQSLKPKVHLVHRRLGHLADRLAGARAGDQHRIAAADPRPRRGDSLRGSKTAGCGRRRPRGGVCLRRGE